MEDSQIIELYWQKNENAISESTNKYGAYCFTIADNILHNTEDSEECVNDTWLHAWNAMPPKRPNVLRMFLAMRRKEETVRLLSFWMNLESVSIAEQTQKPHMRRKN